MTRNQKGFGILEGILAIFIAIVVIGVGGVAYVAHSANSLCGTKSQTYKTEQSKVNIFDTVDVVPGQQNTPASIYDSTEGTCNIDVAQSYSASKDYTVNTDGSSALATETNNLSKQGFKLINEAFSQDGCSDVKGEANYIGKSITITVDFDQPTKQCSTPYVPVQESVFSNASITSIKATVSTPN